MSFIESFKTVVKHILSFITKKDLVRALSDGYHHIDAVYRRSFWIIFGILCFAFGFHTIQFMWGNHDWNLLDHTHRWLGHDFWMREGRYMLSSVKATFLNGIYLPIIYDLTIFMTLALNAVLLCKYWHLKKRITYFVLCGLVLSVQPFTLCMVWYVHMTPEVFLGVTCALAALLLSESIARTKGSLIKKIVNSLIAIILVNFALAVYPVLITTITIAFAGRLLIATFAWEDGTWQQLKSRLIPFSISAVNIMLGVFLYRLMITFVFPTRSFYNTDTLPWDQVLERLIILLKQSFHQLYEYNYPFISQWTLWVFMSFTIALVLSICYTGNLKQKAVRLILLLGSLFATQTAMLVAKTHLIDGRVELFGLVFFEVLVMVVVITRLEQLKNLSIIAGACVIFTSVLNDLDCLRVWKLGFDAENMLWNRVLARLETQEGFNPARKYDVVQIGWPISMRPRYYTEQRKKYVNHRVPAIFDSYDHFAVPFGAYEFYYPSRFRGKGFSSIHADKNIPGHPDYEARLKRLYQAGILQNAEEWPKANGLIVWEDLILFVTDGKALRNYREHFEQELGKK